MDTRTKWALAATGAFVAAAVLLTATVVACVLAARVVAPPRGGGGGSERPAGGGTKATVAVAKLTGQEELVRRWILVNARTPEVVKFLSWGPHLTRGEMEDICREGEITDWELPDAFVRVVFTASERDVQVMVLGDGMMKQPVDGVAEYDWTVAVRGRQILASSQWQFGAVPVKNRHGEKWKSALRRELAKRHPGIRTD